MEINRRKMKTINGHTKEEFRECIQEYAFSFSVVYSLIFATVHFFGDKDSLFINTYGIFAIDLLANIVYCILYSIQYKRNLINKHLENKNEPCCFRTPLLNENEEKSSTVNAYKMLLFLLVTMVYVVYLYVYKFFTGTSRFMDVSNALDYVMFFMSIAYFDFFWDVGYKKFGSNLKSIKSITKEDKILRKYAFYFVLLVVAIYQCYSFISDIMYGISLI